MISFHDISFGYEGQESPVLSRVNLEIAAGEFVLVCGPTGSGKSTFLKVLNGLVPHFTGGILGGSFKIDGVDCTGLQPHELASLVGYVNQQPEGAFVADTVAEEIAYSLEQLGFAPESMEERVLEFATLVGVEHLLERGLQELSGGQQQRVAIASALAAGQKILVLDEPTSALDPAAAGEIVALLKSISKSQNVTVLLAEHRLERVLSQVDSVIVVHGDAAVSKLAPDAAFKEYRLVPPIVELSNRLGWAPVIVEPAAAIGRTIDSSQWRKRGTSNAADAERLLGANDIRVEYGSTVAVADVWLELRAGRVLAVMGENGSGKSSLIWALQGLGAKSAGNIDTPWGDPAKLSDSERLEHIVMVPQKAADLLFLNTLSDELEESDRVAEVKPTSTASLFASFAGRVDPRKHPRDLSAGQQLALVLAIQMVKGARVLLLDEPTRGLDYSAKRALAKIIGELQAQGKAVLLASHDIEFVAQVADEVLVLANGVVADAGSPAEIFGHRSPLASQVSVALQTEGLFTIEQVIA